MYFGLISITNSILPILRKKSSHIAKLSSMWWATSFFGAYSGTTFAVVDHSRAFEQKVGLLWIRVTIVCTNGIRTKFGIGADSNKLPSEIDDYK
jgi:short-subunit dehydrogenase